MVTPIKKASQIIAHTNGDMPSHENLKNPITGIIHVTGEPDTGKTGFALTCGYNPDEMYIVDDDLKTRSALERISESMSKSLEKVFPMYHDFVAETSGKKELEIHAIGMDLIDDMIRKQPKVVIWDTWSRFAKTCHPWVVKHPELFKDFWSPMGTIKGAEQWIAAQQYEAGLYQKMLRAAPHVILITHLKDQRLNGVATGKQIPDSAKPMIQKPTLRIYLRHSASSPAPIGLVLKRIEKWHLGKNGLEMTSVLPRKLFPCTWAKIREYWEHPIGDRTPTPDETPNAFELSILEGTLTKDQMQVFRAGMLGLEEQDVAIEVKKPDEIADAAKELKEQGKGNVAIAKELSERFGKKITTTDIIKYTK